MTAVAAEPTPATSPEAPVVSVVDPVPAVPVAVPDPVPPTPEPAATTLLTTPLPPAAPVLPETYTVTTPEGVALDAAVLERATALAKTLKLPDDASAQAVVNAVAHELGEQVKTLEAATQKGGAIWTETVKQFEKEALADPTIGGHPDDLARTVERGQAVLAKYDASGGFRAFLDTTGLGSSKDVLTFLHHIHQALGEDRFVHADGSAKPERSLTEKLWGKK